MPQYLIIENRPIVNLSDISSNNFVPANRPITSPKVKTSLAITVLLTMLISAVTFGSGGYFLGKMANKTNSSTVVGSQNTETNKVVVSPTFAIPNMSPTTTTSSCKDIVGLTGYQICNDSNKKMSDYIVGPSSIRVAYVSSYSVSPNKEWLFVVSYSNEYAKTGGAPDENALTMVDIKSTKATELFSQIYFPNYTEDSWSSKGNGIVFTAGEAATPNILGNPNMFAVVYCTTTCKVIAKNAGPAGIGGDPAYFNIEKVHYTGMNGEAIEIPFN